MKLTVAGVRAGIVTVLSVAAPLLPILVHHQVISTDDATQIGVSLASVSAAFHGGTLVQQHTANTDQPKGTP